MLLGSARSMITSGAWAIDERAAAREGVDQELDPRTRFGAAKWIEQPWSFGTVIVRFLYSWGLTPIGLAAKNLAPRLELTPERMAELLRRREDENSTLLSPNLAVPHMVVEGKGRFEMLIARMQGGVRFSEDAAKVTTIFVLAATRDERNFHLRALAAIAQVVQESGFEKRWSAAKDAQGLRDVILLSQRRRPKTQPERE